MKEITNCYQKKSILLFEFSNIFNIIVVGSSSNIVLIKNIFIYI